jgi:hemoglobin
MADARTLYLDAGGMPFFEGLAGSFYDAVERDDLLRPLYPEDLGPPRRRLALFLAQYWGGPSSYDEERGHPRLRMRHFPFAIGPAERDRWLELMREALRSMHPPERVADALIEYFDIAAEAMRNRD